MKKLGFGMMRLPKSDKDDETSIIQEEVDKMADLFLEKGFTYFDTAYVYHDGKSEGAFKKAVADKHPHEDYQIADKLPIFAIKKAEEMEPIFQEELERLGVDYIDYFLIHNVSGFSDHALKNTDPFKFGVEKKAEGKVKHVGFSSHADAKYIEDVIKQHPDMDFIQLQINYLDWENDAIQSKECYEVACKYNLPVIVMEPLKGGFLANVPKEAEKLMRDYNGQSPIEWAFRFLISLDNVMMVLSGASSYEQLKENIEIFEDIKPLNDEELEILRKVREIINANIAIDCTGCNYCLSSCPQNILIPKLFNMYNEDMIQNPGPTEFTAVGNAYVNYAKEAKHGLASDCIDCQACIPKCPQHINIPEELVKVKDHFETPLYGFNQQEE